MNLGLRRDHAARQRRLPARGDLQIGRSGIAAGIAGG
jgi:hypothetical protein